VAASIVGTKAIYAGSESLYGIGTAEGGPTDLVWMGGWLTASDRAVGDDRLYQGRFDGTTITGLTPLNFDNAGYAPGYVAGYHANDPSVVYLPGPRWHFMYYTCLANVYATAEQMTRRNWVGFASSPDGGATWTDRGIIIGQQNGFDSTGAWAPSAVVVGGGSEIWLYYHTGSQNCLDDKCSGPGVEPPKVLRTRLAINGWQQLGTEPVLAPEGQLGLVNVDVTFAAGRYWMVGNAGLDKIVLYVSPDGLRFTPFDGAAGELAAGGTNLLLTPRIHVTSATAFDVFFSLGADGSTRSSHLWTFALSR
jgi:hypothetical protein